MSSHLVTSDFTSQLGNIPAGTIVTDLAYPNFATLVLSGLATVPYVTAMDPFIAAFLAQKITNPSASLGAILHAAGFPTTAGMASGGDDFPATFPLGSVAYGSLGSNLVHVAGTRYMASVFAASTRVATGIKVLNGATVGTDNTLVELRDMNGKLLATSALAGALSAGADSFQTLNFLTPITIPPGYYFLVVQTNGTTDKTRRIAASTFPTFAGSVTGVFGDSVASVVPPSGFTADKGPIAQLFT